ncbi:hypothetical protein R6242_08105 [Iodobacter sp. CM08]|uniref:hypothetical protein n=1 Tax=Iodobacter sp. CM08 TaxID=3085902 RepID=UPI002980F3CC|nr:hypothetical protein [Iodobacter sp. CM08]MDW5416537.1 hypothetical protein [Iodobacter sp. CM08]
MKNYALTTMVLALSTALTACGGGGGDSSNTAVATPAVSTGVTNPVKETLAQCIASLSLPADLKVTSTTEGDTAVFLWDGQKKFDFYGKQQFKEGWNGGVYQHYFDAKNETVSLDGESVLQKPSKYTFLEDATNYSSSNYFPYSSFAKEYRSTDGKKLLGWRDDSFDQNGKSMDWIQKNLAINAAPNVYLYDLVKDQPQKVEYTRKVTASWYANEVRSENVKSEYSFVGRETIDTKLGKLDTCVSMENTSILHKGNTESFDITWSSKRWHAAKVGFVKEETVDTEYNASTKALIWDEKRTYEIVGARKNGQRYGSYDLWMGVLTAQASTATPKYSTCDYSSTGNTLGFTWLVKPEANGKGTYRFWDGSKQSELAINYSGNNQLNNFKTQTFDNSKGVGTINWSQNVAFDLANNVLSGSYTRTEKYTKPSVCEGTYPSSIKGSKIF